MNCKDKSTLDSLSTIELEHGFLVEQIRQTYHHELSSHAFTNLFLWREQMKLRIRLQNDHYVVKMDSEGPNTWFFPCGNPDGIQTFVENQMREPNFSMVYLREQDKTWLETQFPDEFDFSRMPDSDEYIFERTALEQRMGSSYANLRNQMNGLFREHEMICKPYTEKEEGLVWNFIRQPFKKKHKQGYLALDDSNIPQTAMTFRHELGLQLVTVWADGILSGVTMGFPLTQDTMDGCIERHNSHIHGLSYLTQMALLLQAAPSYRYMNAEEDLGLPGLRMMKRHMNPCCMNYIWRADAKKE